MLVERLDMGRILCGILLVATAWGQAFEVASVRASRSHEGNRRENIQVSPGSLIMRNVSLKGSIRWAYHVMDYQVSGPEWMGSERFEISAKAGEGVKEEQLRVMLQG